MMFLPETVILDENPSVRLGIQLLPREASEAPQTVQVTAVSPKDYVQ